MALRLVLKGPNVLIVSLVDVLLVDDGKVQTCRGGLRGSDHLVNMVL